LKNAVYQLEKKGAGLFLKAEIRAKTFQLHLFRAIRVHVHIKERLHGKYS
jgi:hypothetical protein